MKRIIYYNLLTICVLAFGCRKIDVEPKDGVPVFSAEAMFNGNFKTWKAGLEDYYMFSSFKKDSLDVYEYSGSFAKTDSVSGEIFTVRIRDVQKTLSGLPSVEEALNPNLNFQYANIHNDSVIDSIVTIGYTTTFDGSSSILPNTPVTYQWDFGDGPPQNGGQIIMHFYDSIPSQPVKLTISALNNSCSSSITRKVILSGVDSCQLLLDLFPVTPVSIDSGFVLEANLLNAIPPFVYNWSTGVSGNIDSIIIKDSIGIINAAVTITDFNGCTVAADITTTYNPGALPQLCLASFDNSPVITENDTIQIIVSGDELQLSKVKIEYTSLDGTFYSSFLQNQPSSSFLKILKTEDYDNNENNEKTKKVTLSYACRIWSETGDFIDITDGKAVVAIAYP